MEAVHKKDKKAWLDNFADDAVVEDPIGASPLDPEGKGHRGKKAIEAFWDRQIEPNRVMFNIKHSYAAGPEVANVGTITIAAQNGTVMLVDIVITYRVNDAGKLAALRAYWEMDKMKVFAPLS
jgi:ketosteroid isomerase-like protein